MRVLIKGAGVAGLTVAHELAATGASVTMVDPAPKAGRGASWYAGGMLAPYCERESAEEPVVTHGREALGWWREQLPDLVHANGTLVVAPQRDRSQLDRFAARTSG